MTRPRSSPPREPAVRHRRIEQGAARRYGCGLRTGPIGLMACQLVKVLGAGTVIFTGARKERLEMGKKLGAADILINVKEQDVVRKFSS